jgi:hypothetical protein
MRQLVFPALRFLVVGTQRSGTTFAAALFSALGCPCTHEGLFQADRLRRRYLAGRLLGRLLRLDAGRAFLRPEEITFAGEASRPGPPRGESSWLAAPYLAALPPGTVVLHQLREPLAVLRSVRRNWLLTDSTRRTFVEQYVPAFARGAPLERAMLYWLEWNALAARAEQLPHLRYFRYRVEDLSPVLLQAILDLIGFPVEPTRLSAALDAVPPTINTRGSKRRDHLVTWKALPAGNLRERLARAAAAYGYPAP